MEKPKPFRTRNRNVNAAEKVDESSISSDDDDTIIEENRNSKVSAAKIDRAKISDKRKTTTQKKPHAFQMELLFRMKLNATKTLLTWPH